MNKKKAKLIFKHNYFEIVEEGDYVLCAISGKQIPLEKLNYWNVDLQEAYFSPVEVNKKFKLLRKSFLFPPIMCPKPLTGIFYNHFFHFLIKIKSKNCFIFLEIPRINCVLKFNCKIFILISFNINRNNF